LSFNRDQVIEGFDQFSFRLGGVEVGSRRRSGLRLLLPGFLLFLSAAGRSLFRSRLRNENDGRSGRLYDWRGCLRWGWTGRGRGHELLLVAVREEPMAVERETWAALLSHRNFDKASLARSMRLA
jgi:hypothetical protein